MINQRIGSNCRLHPITVMMPIKKPKDPVLKMIFWFKDCKFTVYKFIVKRD